MKKENNKKITAAVIASIVMIAFFIFYMIFPALFIADKDTPIFFPFFPIILGIGFIICVIVVLRERIREVKSGQEDDLDKY